MRANASVLGVIGISLTSGALAGFIVDPYLYERTDRSIASDRVTFAALGRYNNRFLHTALRSSNPANMRVPTSRVVDHTWRGSGVQKHNAAVSANIPSGCGWIAAYRRIQRNRTITIICPLFDPRRPRPPRAGHDSQLIANEMLTYRQHQVGMPRFG